MLYCAVWSLLCGLLYCNVCASFLLCVCLYPCYVCVVGCFITESNQFHSNNLQQHCAVEKASLFPLPDSNGVCSPCFLVVLTLTALACTIATNRNINQQAAHAPEWGRKRAGHDVPITSRTGFRPLLGPTFWPFDPLFGPFSAGFARKAEKRENGAHLRTSAGFPCLRQPWVRNPALVNVTNSHRKVLV